ncbi:hypothetical protein [Ottowia testudinis]|uniref:Uncharacterized protein n=1 Tax=Ottowia testudinis TaxID=2816950 RepID=A0A975H4I7_9BURK|nr:hypothetical protein [Ottowia testudinis]QTD46410.1 hypothetical protein J1M35_05865 [Ottowia testudinis]
MTFKTIATRAYRTRASARFDHEMSAPVMARGTVIKGRKAEVMRKLARSSTKIIAARACPSMAGARFTVFS